MHAVVIDRLQGETAALAKAAASALGVTAYEVRASLNVPGGGPAVVAVIADPGRAEETRAAVQAGGLPATVVPVVSELPAFDVRGFQFGEQGIRVRDRRETARDVPYASVELLVRATAVVTQTKTKVVRERKFAPMRSVLSGGLVNTKVEQSRKTTRSTDSEDLLYVFMASGVPLRMRAQELLYEGLGPALAPSRTANFAHTVDELRRRCTRAGFDERLRRRAIQSQILGRMLSADDYLEFAVSMVMRSLRGP